MVDNSKPNILTPEGEKPFTEVLKALLFKSRLLLMLLLQLALVGFSYLAAFYIRFDFNPAPEYVAAFHRTLPLLLVSRMIAYYYYKLHSSSWQFVSMRDLMDTLKGALLGSVLFIVLIVFIYNLEVFPRSVILIETLLNVVLAGGSRFLSGYYHESRGRKTPKRPKHVLVVGAGKAGVLMLNEVRTNIQLGVHVVGFVDDNPYKKGTFIHGVPVLGSTKDIPDLVKEHSIDEIIVAIPSAGYKEIIRATKIAQEAGVTTKVLPGLGKLMQDDPFVTQLRDVPYDDLLGRKAVRFGRESDHTLLRKEIAGKTVLVTGAGGSIGAELCRQVAKLSPRVLILYERHENWLYDLELELRKIYSNQTLLPVIGDILDPNKFETILRSQKVDLIYHAAAYKHVPMMEREPIEAVRNNIIGTMNIAKLAIKYSVDKFILISTDKAVNPASVMGTTKRVAELITQCLDGRGTRFAAVRFGNVLGSNGSVIPLFKKQVAVGGPITVTHPETTRYFMSIPEAVQLIMTAGAMAKGAEIFLLDMGKPIKIVDLAMRLIKQSGLEPGKDIEIVFTGLRPGEKLHEELYWQGEGIVPTENKKITMLKPERLPHAETIFSHVRALEECTAREDLGATFRILKKMVPEAKTNSMTPAEKTARSATQDEPPS